MVYRSIGMTGSVLLFCILGMQGCGESGAAPGSQNIQHVSEYHEAPKPLVIGEERVYDSYENVKRTRALSQTDQTQIRADGLQYLNRFRQNAGMILYSPESHLDSAAYNHAHYLMINNATGHGESSDNPGYTGASPSARAVYAGYLHRQVGENLNSGNNSVQEAIDGLFSAIYHRFGFLSFQYNEIGMGADTSETHPYGSAYNFDMGISQISALCAGESFNGSGSYYYGVCADPDFKIEASKYESAVGANEQQNPKYVIWPYSGQQDARPVFFEESPDPLPECSVSGYPVSVQFNEKKSGEIDLQSFELFYDENHTKVTNVKLLDRNSDPNNRFSAYEYALFPLDRLDWNRKYSAKVTYLEDGVSKTIAWTFKTKSLPHPYYNVVQKDSSFNVKSGQTYLFYLPPANCNDGGAGYSYNYTGDITIESSFYDYNTIQIKVTGTNGTVSVSPRNGRDFTLHLSDTDSAVYPSDETAKRRTKSDFNRDGISDIFWRNGTENSLWLMREDGSHKWVPQVAKPLGFEVVGIGDFNKDGIADIFWRNGTHNSLWLMRADGSHKWVNQVAKPEGYKVVGVGDFNKDGIDDIFWRNGTENSLWLMREDGSHKWVPQVAKPLGFEVVGVGDFNKDGIDDIFWRNGTENSLWLMREDGSHKWVPQVAKPLGFEVVGIGDFNKDGIADIFWRNGIHNSLWLMRADGSHKWVNQVAKPEGYKVVGVGDFNKDGIDDIFWRNGTENSLWLMREDGSHKWVPQVAKPIDFKVHL